MSLDAPQPTLELYGQSSRILHRPRLVAAGCILLALAAGIQTAVLLSDLAAWLFRGLLGSPRGVMRVQLFILIVYHLIDYAGIAAVWLGNVAREGVRPTPLRLMALMMLAADAMVAVADGLLLSKMNNLMLLGSFAYDIYFPTITLAALCVLISWSAAIVYTLRVSTWLQSQVLWRGSVIVLGAQLAVDAAIGMLWCVLWVRDLGWWITLPEPLLLAALRLLVVLRLLAAGMLICYLVTLARRLSRWPRV